MIIMSCPPLAHTWPSQTLLNRILAEDHGKKLVVVENEFGKVGIDGSLVKKKLDTKEEIIEMNNGCLCCSVRGDLVKALSDLFRRGMAIDGIIIETLLH